MFNHHRKSDDPPGFCTQRLHRYDGDLDEIYSVELLLPATAQLSTHAKNSLARSEREQSDSAIAKLSAMQTSEAKKPDVPPARPAWPSKKSTELDAEEEREGLQERMEADAAKLSASHVAVYAWDEPMRLVEHVRTVDRDAIARNKKLFLRLRDRGHIRPLACPYPGKLSGGLHDLLAEHPNFAEVIDFVRDQLALTSRLGKSLHIPPILLLGPPGIGKTHFCNSLAKVLGTAIHRLGFDAAHSSSALLGSDKNWGNSTSGLLFDAVCLGEQANPIILLDEIDKARSGEGYQHPLASLHSLLEPVSAGSVRDISLDYAFDASHVLWIAAANEPTAVPATLRSRFAEFWVEAPTGAAALQLAQGLLKRTHATMALDSFTEPGYAFARLLAHLTAREQRQALTRAYAAAIANGRNHLIRQDLPAEVLIDDTGSTTTSWLH